MAPIVAATRYALTVFAAGFLLGTFRVLWRPRGSVRPPPSR